MVGALLEPLQWSVGRKTGEWEGHYSRTEVEERTRWEQTDSRDDVEDSTRWMGTEDRDEVQERTALPLCASPPRPGETVFTQVITLVSSGSSSVRSA